MAAILSNVIISCRTLVGDGPMDNLVRQENVDNPDMGNTINGVNKTFALSNYPVVPNGLVGLNVDGSPLTSNYTIVESTAEITTVTAPTSTMTVSYYFYLMNDTSWTEFVASALEILNLSSGVPATDILTVPEGLLQALKSYACGYYCMRLSVQTGLWYNQKLQEREENRENISRKFLQAAQEWKRQADALLAAYYSGSGSQLRPSMKVVTRSPRPYTPFR